jgi:predicted AAA+ superfamily ATPase
LSLSHFRSHAGREVDLVLESRDGSLCAVEMKFGSTIRSEDFEGLRYLREVVGKKFRYGYVIYSGECVVSLAPDLHALPISAIW